MNIIGAGAEVTIVNSSSPNAHVFLVRVNNVNISGFTISGAAEPYSGIYIEANNSNIFNNRLVNNYNGIYLYHISKNLWRNTIKDNYVISANAGIHLYHSFETVIEGNNVNSGVTCISLVESDKNSIINNMLKNAYSHGIFFWTSSNNSVTQNTAVNNKYGIYLYGDSYDNYIAYNNLYSNLEYDLYNWHPNIEHVAEYNWWGTTNCTLIDEHIYDDDEGYGEVDFEPILNGPFPGGVPVSCAVDSDGDGILDIEDNCPDVPNYDQEDDDSDNVGNVCDNCIDAFNPDQGNSDSDSHGNACDNCWFEDNDDQEDWDTDCPAMPYSSDPSCGDTCDSIECGDTITRDTYLDHNLNCIGDGLITGANSVTLNCQGHTIRGSNTGIGITITNKVSARIRNCIIENFESGVFVSQSDHASLSSDIIQNNVQAGLVIDSSTITYLQSSDVINNYIGISLISSNDSQILYNDINDNEVGMKLSSSNSNTIYNNDVIGNHQGINILDSDLNTLSTNFVQNNQEIGINLTNSYDNRVYNNYFNNTNNAMDNGVNNWSITKSLYSNIIGGAYLGGNYWNDYVGEDSDGDDLGDNNLPYNSNGGIIFGGDYLPLVQPAAMHIYGSKVLTADLLDVPANGIVIHADDIYLICNGHTIRGSGNGYGIVVNNHKNILIKNCTIENFNEGIRLNQTNNSRVTDNFVKNNFNGISLVNSFYNDVKENTVMNNSGWIYPPLTAAKGVSLQNSSHNDIENNAVINNTEGLYLIDSNNNNIKDNIASNNTESGIILVYSSYNVMANNTVNSDSGGFELLRFCTNNILESNIISNNKYSGIHVEYSSGNTITSNVIDNSGTYGIWLLGAAKGNYNNVIYNNIFYKNHLKNARDDSGTNYWNIVKIKGKNVIGGPYIGGNFWSDYDTNYVSKDGFGERLYNANGNIATGGDYLPLVYLCGTVIENDTILYSDMKCPDPRVYGNESYEQGIIFDADNITLDCRGHVITGTQIPYSGEGIVSELRSNITIKNCVVNQFDKGVKLHHTEHSELINNNLTSNGNGFYLQYDSNNNTLKRNIVYGNTFGFYLLHSDYNNITKNNASGNAVGFYLISSEENMMNSNEVNGTFVGFELRGSSRGNTMSNNTVQNNINYGFGLYTGSDYNVISSNIITDCGIGAHIMTIANIIYNNLFANNDNNANDVGTNQWYITPKISRTNIIGGPYVAGNFWDDYKGRDTTGDGIGDTHLPHNSSGGIISGGDYYPLVRCGNGALNPEEECDDGNSIKGDGCSAFCKLECGGIVYQDVKLNHDILNCPSQGLNISANNIVLDCNGHSITGTGNIYISRWGIYNPGFNSVTIKNCNVSGFTRGIMITASDHNIVHNNTLTHNNGFAAIDAAIYVNNSYYTTLTQNNIFYNNVHGILLRYSNNSLLKFNLLCRNSESITEEGITNPKQEWFSNVCDKDFCLDLCPSCYNQRRDAGNIPQAMGLPEETGVDCGTACPGKEDCCLNGFYDPWHPHYEYGVDCGSTCPAYVCKHCDEFPYTNPGNAEEAEYFALDTDIVKDAAMDAVYEYHDYLVANTFLTNKTVEEILDSSDLIMEAVAHYVEEHMAYDNDIINEVQAADYTISSSEEKNCLNDYCGDCEDFAILREALMRSLKVASTCAYVADNAVDWHTFNIVYYKGKWRIMDYGELGDYFDFNRNDGLHYEIGNVWNDITGEYHCTFDVEVWPSCYFTEPEDIDAKNYLGGSDCGYIDGEWRIRTYKQSLCP